ncbi:MAG: hypothetical protein KGL95_13015, partial [Patescibacteria group bacterium]|nr:hypothetical protein [Patescibacteria group bacterium]
LVRVTKGSFEANEEITSAGWFDKASLPSEEEFAFDHRVLIMKFYEYLAMPFSLPLIGKL